MNLKGLQVLVEATNRGVAIKQIVLPAIFAVMDVFPGDGKATSTGVKEVVEQVGGKAGKEAAVGGVNNATNRATHEVYKDGLRVVMEKPAVSDKSLASLVDDLYRPNATVGSGSTAAAVRQELATGQPIGGVFHSQQAQDSIVALQKWLDRNPTARPGDRAAAENIILDMGNALRGK